MTSSEGSKVARVEEGGLPTTTLRKVTVLDGYYATGDYECFVFDKFEGPDAYPRFNIETAREYAALQDANRVYPNDLLPDGASYGRWIITVEFTPTTEAGNQPTPSSGVGVTRSGGDER